VSYNFLNRIFARSGLYSFSGLYDHHTLQRWRAISVEGVFNVNHNLETALNVQLTASISKLESCIQKFTAEPSGKFHLIGFEEHHQLIRIVNSARELSFKIQHGILSRRLFVTIAATREARVDKDFGGTYAFGLERLAEGGRTDVLEAKEITGQRMRSFVGY
jgi:hypothetical protein